MQTFFRLGDLPTSKQKNLASGSDCGDDMGLSFRIWKRCSVALNVNQTPSPKVPLAGHPDGWPPIRIANEQVPSLPS